MGLTRPRLGQFQTTTTAFDDELIVLNNDAGAGVVWNESRNPVAGAIIGKSIENKNTEAEEIIEVVVGVR